MTAASLLRSPETTTQLGGHLCLDKRRKRLFMRSIDEWRPRSTTNEINEREIDNRKKLTSLSLSFRGVVQSFRKSWYSCMHGDCMGKYTNQKSHKGNSVDLQTLLMTCL